MRKPTPTDESGARQSSDWRLIVHHAADGAWNMAVDDAILEGYGSSRTPLAPTLRLYAWRPAALSLGRSQRSTPDLQFLRRERIDLVRRPTGGSAVLHEHERTYSVVGRLREPPFCGGVLETYRVVARVLAAALGRLGIAARLQEPLGRTRGEDATPASCFARLSSHEISVDGQKVVGSAQLRRAGAFLQHGSILLRADPNRWARALGSGESGGRFSNLVRLLGDGAPDRLDAALIASFEEHFGVRLVAGSLGPLEEARAQQLRASKYLSASWTLEGKGPGELQDRRP